MRKEEEPAISGKDFEAFLLQRRWSDGEAMRQLGIGSNHTIAKFKKEGGPLWLALALAALARGIAPWPR